MTKADELRERIALLEQEYKYLIELKGIAQLRAVSPKNRLHAGMYAFLLDRQIDPDAFFDPDFFKDKSNQLKSNLHQVFCDLELESLSPWKKEDSGGSQAEDVSHELVKKDASYLKDSSLYRQCLSMLNMVQADLSESDLKDRWNQLSPEEREFMSLVFFGSTLSLRDFDVSFLSNDDFTFWFICWSGNYELMSWLFSQNDGGKTNFIELQLQIDSPSASPDVIQQIGPGWRQYFLDRLLVSALRGEDEDMSGISAKVSDEMITTLIDCGANPRVDIIRYRTEEFRPDIGVMVYGEERPLEEGATYPFESLESPRDLGRYVGGSALFYAAEKGRLKLLIDKGVDIDVNHTVGNRGVTLLMCCCNAVGLDRKYHQSDAKSHLADIQALIDLGAEVGKTDSLGIQALDYALDYWLWYDSESKLEDVETGKVVKMLVDAHPDPHEALNKYIITRSQKESEQPVDLSLDPQIQELAVYVATRPHLGSSSS